MRRFVMGLLLVPFFGLLSLPASAQLGYDLEYKTGFALRLGVFGPIEDDLSDLSDVWFALGFDVENPRGFLPNAATVLSGDWFSYSGGRDTNIIPVLLNQRWYSGIWGQRTYYQVGIGVGFLDFRPSDTVFAARVGFGYEFSDNLFGEVNFYWTDEHNNGVSGSGLTAFVGVRFR